jgi:4-carboxymuconolactone decarboxylase
MTTKETSLRDEGDFGTFGRFQETPVAQMAPDMREAFDFTHKLRGMVPGPHRIWVANPKLSKTIVPTGDYYQHSSTLTKAEIEIVTLLTTARWRAAYGAYEHEKIAEKTGHLAADRVERIVAGRPTAFDDPREDVVYAVAAALVEGRIVPVGLFKRAKALIGDAGLVDVAVLIGWFTMVSSTLNLFDVPANAVGLEQ